jgi:hypothetical protein
MTSWTDLDTELAQWADTGRVATIWWRDDDAAAVTPSLERLLLLRRAHEIGLGLAVIPAALQPELRQRLHEEPQDVAVLQHGYAHQNHAPPSEKKIELGLHRPLPIIIGELATGLMALTQAFGVRFLPVMVPPWNRIAPRLVPVLPEIGLRGLSAFGMRARALPVRGLQQVNTHVDLIDWRGRRGFVGVEAALGAFAGYLNARRTADPAAASADEPTGVLSHHGAHDDEAWAFLDRLWNRLRTHPAVRIVPPKEIFGT